jgi:hypothetical protein
MLTAVSDAEMFVSKSVYDIFFFSYGVEGNALRFLFLMSLFLLPIHGSQPTVFHIYSKKAKL